MVEKENSMKKCSLVPLAVIALLLSGGGRVFAQANDNDGCSDATPKGDYATTISAQILNADGTITSRTGVSIKNFDGHGNITFVDYVAFLTPGRVPPGGIDLNPAFRTGLTGTYHVNADCTGAAEFDFPPPPGVGSGQVVKLMFVLAAHGSEIHAVVASLVPAGQNNPVPVLIHEDGKKLGD
jgi:hypothetical protein